MKNGKKLLAVVLTVLMLVALLPMGALALDETPSEQQTVEETPAEPAQQTEAAETQKPSSPETPQEPKSDTTEESKSDTPEEPKSDTEEPTSDTPEEPKSDTEEPKSDTPEEPQSDTPEEPVYYTVTFKDYDGSTLAERSVLSGGAAEAPSKPTRTGYKFDKWDKAFNCITCDLVVTAVYVENAVTGTVVEEETSEDASGGYVGNPPSRTPVVAKSEEPSVLTPKAATTTVETTEPEEEPEEIPVAVQDPETTEGEAPEGEATEGEATEGEAPEGEEGETPEGEAPAEEPPVEPVVMTLSVTVTFAEGAEGSISVQPVSSDGGSAVAAQSASGTTTLSFDVVATDANSAEGAQYTYYPSAEVTGGNIAIGSISGNAVSVVAAAEEVEEAPEEEAVIVDIDALIAGIAKLPSVEDAKNLDPDSEEFKNKKAEFNDLLARIQAMTEEQRTALGSDIIAKMQGLMEVFSKESGEAEGFEGSPPTSVTVNVSINATGIQTPATKPASVTVNLSNQAGMGMGSQPCAITYAGDQGTGSVTFSGIQSADAYNGVYTFGASLSAIPTGFNGTAANNIPGGGTGTIQLTYMGTATLDYDVPVTVSIGAGGTATQATVSLLMNNAVVSTYTGAATGTLTKTGVLAGSVMEIVATPLAGYEASVAWNGTPTGLATVTYTYVGDLVSYSGTIYWGNVTFVAPTVNITLSNGQTLSCTSGDNSYIFPNLVAGTNYSISVSHPNNGYDVTLGAVSIVNGNYHQDIHINGRFKVFHLWYKVNWVDDGNSRGRRPIEWTAYLYCDGAPTGREQQVGVQNGWVGVFPDNGYTDGAEMMRYSVRLAKVPHYRTYYTRLSATSIRITNVYGAGYGDGAAAPKVGDSQIFYTPARQMDYAIAAARMNDLKPQVVRASDDPTDTTIDFDTLKKTNRDVIAWITSEDGEIDYPIVQSSNNSEYMTKLFTGETSGSGAIFVDSNNRSNFTDRNTVIYGHNMSNGSMFADLLNYSSQSFYNSNRMMYLYTPAATYELEVFAAFTADDAYSNIAKRSFSGNSAYLSFLKKCINESDVQSDVSIDASDKIVTLVTCTDDYNDGTRYVVMAKLTKVK